MHQKSALSTFDPAREGLRLSARSRRWTHSPRPWQVHADSPKRCYRVFRIPSSIGCSRPSIRSLRRRKSLATWTRNNAFSLLHDSIILPSSAHSRCFGELTQSYEKCISIIIHTISTKQHNAHSSCCSTYAIYKGDDYSCCCHLNIIISCKQLLACRSQFPVSKTNKKTKAIRFTLLLVTFD